MSLITHLNKVVEASGKKSFLGLIFSLEGLKIFADGNIAYVLRNPLKSDSVCEHLVSYLLQVQQGHQRANSW
jgi:hypothetical protein